MKPVADLSLGWRTDLIFPRFDAFLIERADCLVVHTPHNPSFWWGNCLLFDHAPREGDAARWLARFEEEIVRRNPDTRHVALGVDSAEAFELPPDFIAAGFELASGAALTMQRDQLHAPRTPLTEAYAFGVSNLETRSAELVELQVAADEGRHPPTEGYRLFRARQMQRYAAMVRAGLGDWFAITARGPDGDTPVSDCGLFRDGRLGRFQFVSTHPSWRRRGLCGALIHAVARHGFDVMQLDTLVIVADPDDVAIGVYESVGFERGERTWRIQRRPQAS